MKKTIGLLLIALAVMLIIPAVTPANSPAQAQQEVKTPPPPPPPTGVSPADPDIDPPAIGVCRCPNCGAECPQMGKRTRFDRPMLGSRNARMVDNPDRNHGFNRSGRRNASRGMHATDACSGECRGACSIGSCGDGCRGTCDMSGHKHGVSGHRGCRHGERPHMSDCRGDRPDMHKHRDGNAASRLVLLGKKLDLTKEQVAKLEKLSYDTKAKVIDLRAAMEKEKLEMRHLHLSGSDDLAAIKAHLKAIADLRVELQTAKIANRIEAKKILTDKQQKMIMKRVPEMDHESND